jgi:predicted transcriptional regulator of viral defense system
LGAIVPSDWREDPWIVAVTTFSPCYIGGWTAAEHWDLTEQVFRDIVVMTAAPIRKRTVVIQDTVFRLKFLDPAKHFGTRVVWRARTKVHVSDPSRTLIDILDAPQIGGGIRHVAEIVSAYFDSEHRDDRYLVDYATKLGNRAVFKRLGYLIEVLKIHAPDLISRCRSMQSSGLSALDPGVQQSGLIVKRWNLRVNSKVVPQMEIT